MKKVGLFILIFTIVVVITACGSAPPPPPPTKAPEPTATAAPAPTEKPAEAATAAPAAAPTEKPAEAATAAPASAPAEGDVMVVDVIMNTSGYEPTQLKLKPGQKVTFNFENTDDEEHDLYNRQIGMEVSLGPGDSISYEWVAPDQPGEYIAECSFHEGLRMVYIVE